MKVIGQRYTIVNLEEYELVHDDQLRCMLRRQSRAWEYVWVPKIEVCEAIFGPAPGEPPYDETIALAYEAWLASKEAAASTATNENP